MLTYTDAPGAHNGHGPKQAPGEIGTDDAATAQASFSDSSGSTAEVKATISALPFEWFTTVASRIGTIAGALAGTVAFVYIVGGAIMWIRFKSADLPADQAVGLVSRNDLMVIGLRVMVLPALLAGVVFFFLARRERRRAAARSRIPLRQTLAWIVAIAVFALLVPFTPGALAWPLAAFALWLVWHRSLASECHAHSNTGFPLWRAAIVAALLAAVVSLARQFDHPTQLATATVQVGDEPKRIGVLVSESGDRVAVGFSKARSIQVFSRSQLTSLVVGPALDERAPARSLLSRVLPGQPPWAATPLEIWCGGERYQLYEIGKLCKTQPEIAGIGDADRGAVTVLVRCPAEASSGCSGWLSVTTADPVAVRTLDRRARVVVGKSAFQIPAGSELDVRVRMLPRVARVLAGLARGSVPLDAVVSLDLAGDAVIVRRELATRFTKRSVPESNAGGARERDPVPLSAPAGESPGAAAGGEGAEDPEPTPTPTPTPAAVQEDPAQTAPAERIDPDAPIELAPPDTAP